MYGLKNIFTVCFFGHREVDNYQLVESKTFEIVADLIRNKEYVDFLVGRNGEFDQIVSSAVKKAQRNVFHANSSLILVLPYLTAEYRDNVDSFDDYYDNVEIMEDKDTHFKAAIQKRNREMVDRSDLCVFYVDHNSGGAYQTMKYAEKQGKEIVNIAIRN